MRLFARLAGTLSGSRYIIWIYFVFLLGFVISLFAFYEDYTSSYNSYLMFPTRKSTHAVIVVIALLPQVGQIAFGYAFGDSVYKTEAGKIKASAVLFIIGAILMVYDLGTDIFYKAFGMGGWVVWLFAAAESIVVFTIGSEILLTVCLGYLVVLFPSFIAALTRFFGAFFSDEDEEDDLPIRRR